MHKNILSYWRHLENLPDGHKDRPSPRVCVLLQETFEKWNAKPSWLKMDQLGHVFDHYPKDELDAVKSLSIAERKALAIKKTFEIICQEEVTQQTGSLDVHPDELIVGTLPPYSVGQGKELMRYLTTEETLFWELRYLNEWSPFGHTVPDHEIVLELGLVKLMRKCQDLQLQIGDATNKKHRFYQSVIDSLEGVLYYVNAYADKVQDLAEKFKNDKPRAQNLADIAARLRRCPAQPCDSFMDALQTIYIMHCALHYTGEIVPIGRLDQLLYKYYRADIDKGILTAALAQEAIDCFWIKLDEKVVLNRRFVEDRFTSSDGALLGAGGPSNFDQGALINQWMQQITIGGVIANNDEQPLDATNEVTFLCLNAARRLPLNSPTLDLRVHSGTNKDVLQAAAEALLSGGAHPVIMNDDKIIPALHKKTGGSVELKSARNYACDGCYETLFAGETEFSFGFVSALDVLEKSLNSGAGFAFSGGTNLRGSKGSYRSKNAGAIKSFDEFWQVLEKHVLLGCHRFMHGILSSYGSKEEVSPSPLLSAMINGCIEKGKDISGGGARYRLFSPLMTGISTAADSLYVIQSLVFDKKLFSLEELVACLRSNWGRTTEIVGLKLPDERIAAIRGLCTQQPKFGSGVTAVDQLAWRLVNVFYDKLQEARHSPVHQSNWERLGQLYNEPNHPFEILFAPGVGTFEQFNFGGSFVGATPDGRFAFAPIASDLSPSPLHPDIEPAQEFSKRVQNGTAVQFMDGLKSYMDPSIELLSDGAPSDFNIPENFNADKLTDILYNFSQGRGGNMLTVTVADPETFAAAQANPTDYNLLRVRMGGWSEFFISLFPALQEQHKRRPLFI